MKFAFFSLLFFSSIAMANVEIPEFTPNVVDAKSYLALSEAQEINKFIEGIKAQTQIKVAVYILEKLQTEPIEQLATRTFEKWKIGSRKNDDGLLLVIAMQDRKSRIETGYGLEGDLPDAFCRQALDDYLAPQLRSNRLKDGIIQTLHFLALKKNPQFNFEEKNFSFHRSKEQFDPTAGFVALCIFVLLLTYFYVWKSHKPFRRYRTFQYLFLILFPGLLIYVTFAILFARLDFLLNYLNSYFSPPNLQLVMNETLSFVFLLLVNFVLVYGPLALTKYRLQKIKSKFLEAEPALRKTYEKAKNLSFFYLMTDSIQPILTRSLLILFCLLSAALQTLVFSEWQGRYAVALAYSILTFIFCQIQVPHFKTSLAFKNFLLARISKEQDSRRRLRAIQSERGRTSYDSNYSTNSSSHFSSSDSDNSSNSGGGSSGGGGASSDW